jgi:uncharacterized protein YjbI with pentapeptide repeats
VVGIAVVVLALAIVWALFVPAADWLAHHDVGSAKPGLLQTARDAAQGRLLTLAAGLFAGGALVFTARNFTLSRRTLELTEQGQATERYTRAVEQLGSDKLDVRIGGIYALERVARDSARDHPTVAEVLTAFIREHSHDQWPPPEASSRMAWATRGRFRVRGRAQERSTRPDVQAALTVVGRRDQELDIRPIDLARANLTTADLTRASLPDADLTDADLIDADLTRADLTDADLTDTDLTRANLSGANLTSASLPDADLTGANLATANLTRAILTGAMLTGAILTSADLAHANLSGAILTNAILTSADLAHANLTEADLTSADLAYAKLTDASFTRANLTRANLFAASLTDADLSRANLTDARFTDADLTGARWSRTAPAPAGWKLDAGSGRLKRMT